MFRSGSLLVRVKLTLFIMFITANSIFFGEGKYRSNIKIQSIMPKDAMENEPSILTIYPLSPEQIRPLSKTEARVNIC